MSLINSHHVVNLLLKRNGFLYAAVRNHWNKDYKPLPYPKTQEERNRAAAKYGLLPSEYEPYPDDGSGFGDYPKLPAISSDSKDPFYPWDDPALKRNFNETLHDDADLMGEDRYDVNAKLRFPLWEMWLKLFGALALAGSLFLICENFRQFPGTVPKQYPYQGKVHYTFEK